MSLLTPREEVALRLLAIMYRENGTEDVKVLKHALDLADMFLDESKLREKADVQERLSKPLPPPLAKKPYASPSVRTVQGPPRGFAK